MSLGKRFIHGAGLGLIEQGLRFGSVFVTTPLMVHWLGDDSYGYWLLAMTLMSYFALLDLGMSYGTMRFLAVAVGAKDAQRQAVVYDMATTHFRRVSWVIGVGSVIALSLLAIFGGEKHLSLGTVLLATFPAGLSMAMRFWWRMPQLLLRAWVRYDLLSWSAIIRVATQCTVLILFLPRGGGLVLVGMLHAGCDMLELALQYWFATGLPTSHHVPVVENAEAMKVRKDLISYTGDLVLGSMGDAMRGNVGPWVTRKVVSLSMVPVYATGTRLISMAEDVVNSVFGGSLLSIFGQLHGGDDKERLKREFSRVLAITSGISAAGVLGMMLFGRAFMVRWLGPKFGEAYEVMQILGGPYALFFMQYPAHSLLCALGWQRQLMVLRCVSGLLAGAAAIVFGLLWGLKGVAWGPAMEMAVIYAVAFPILVGRATGIPAMTYLWNLVLWPGLKGLLLPALAGWALLPWIEPDYQRLIICGSIYGLAMAVSSPFTLLDGEGRHLLLSALGMRRKKASPAEVNGPPPPPVAEIPGISPEEPGCGPS